MYHVTLHKMRYSALASSNFIRRLETRLVPIITIFEKKLNFTHMTISFSGFIYFKCLHTSFLVQRDHTRLGLINFRTPQDMFYRYNFTHACISNFMYHKSTPTRIFLRFTFIQIQVVFLSFFLSSIKYNIIFTGIHREQHEAITLSYFTQHLLSNIYGLFVA